MCRLRRLRHLQPLKVRLALYQCLLYRSKLAPPHGPLRAAHLLRLQVRAYLTYMPPVPAFL